MFLCFAIATRCVSVPWHSGAITALFFAFPLLPIAESRLTVADLCAALRLLCLTLQCLTLPPQRRPYRCPSNAVQIFALPKQVCSFRRTAFASSCNAPPMPTNALPKPYPAKICFTAAEPCFAHANQCYAILFQCRSLHRRLGLCIACHALLYTSNVGVALPFLRNLGWSMLNKAVAFLAYPLHELRCPATLCRCAACLFQAIRATPLLT